MQRNPRDIVRYNASERLNHWIVGFFFIALVLTGLAMFHPAFFPLTQLFGGGPWTRILHPYFGVGMPSSSPSWRRASESSTTSRSVISSG